MRAKLRSLGVAVAVVLAGTAMPAAGAHAAATAGAGTARATEEQQLQALYARATDEGGRLTVYMGGDAPGQWDQVAQAFAATFPRMQLRLVTDLSKVHGPRIDNQLATTGRPVADVAIMQTTHDFDRWKRTGQLLRYRPIGYDQMFASAKDPDGFWSGVFYGAFSYVVNAGQLPANPASFRATDLLQPRFKDRLIFTYPNDDDAVLFGFKLIIDRYGWRWLRDVMAQNPDFVRGTPGSTAGVGSGQYLATAATAGDPRPNGVVVRPSGERFVSWAQRGAIFRRARHKAAARLFLSWVSSRAFQRQAIASFTWSVRRDVAPPAGLRALSTYNTNPRSFPRFMANRAAVERFRDQVELYVGAPQGPDPADPQGTLGRRPGAF